MGDAVRTKALFRAVATLCLAAASTACASLPPLTGPRQGGPPWHELETAHLVLDTDIDVDEANAEIVWFERFYGALHQVARVADVPGKTRVVHFARSVDYHAFAKPTDLGHFQTSLYGDPDGLPTMVFESERVVRRIVFLHELAHRFNHVRFFSIPMWLDEGLAEYASTLTIDGDYAVVGGDNRIRGFLAPSEVVYPPGPEVRVGLLDPSRAWSIESLAGATHDGIPPEELNAFYTSSWRLVEILEDGADPALSQAFHSMLSEVEAGKPESSAFDDAFGENGGRLETLYQEYVNARRLKPYRFLITERPSGVPAVRQLSDAEVHVLWAKLAGSADADLKLAKRELELAAATEPESLEVRFARAVNFCHLEQWEDARREIDRTVRVRPEDPRFLLIQSVAERGQRQAEHRSLGPLSEESSLLLDRLARNAKTAVELDEVGIARAIAGQADEGRQYAEAAIRHDNRCVSCWILDADLLLREKRLDEARHALARVETLLADDALPPQVKDDVLRLRKALKPQRKH